MVFLLDLLDLLDLLPLLVLLLVVVVGAGVVVALILTLLAAMPLIMRMIILLSFVHCEYSHGSQTLGWNMDDDHHHLGSWCRPLSPG